jgi:hypothetical protein
MRAIRNASGPGRAAGRAFTLVEVMLSTAILTTVVIVSTMYLISMTDSISSEMTQSSLEINGSRALTEIADAMTDSKVTDGRYVVPDATKPDEKDLISTWVRLKQPVDLSGASGLLDEYASDPFDIWGVRMPGSMFDQPGWVEYRFVPSVRPEDTLDETVLGDVNGDGVVSGTYTRGWLRRKWHGDTTHGASPNEDGRTQDLLWGILQAGTSPTFCGDIDGDTNADPIFKMDHDTQTLEINLWLYGRDGRARHVLHNARTRVVLRNQ